MKSVDEILQGSTVYNYNKYSEKDTKNVAAELKAYGVEKAEVTGTEGQNGYFKSLCLFLHGNRRTFVKLSKYSKLQEGDKVKLDSICLITLGREGDTDSEVFDGEKED